MDAGATGRPNNNARLAKKPMPSLTVDCGCCSAGHMTGSYSSISGVSGEYSVAVDSSELTSTREEYRYMSQDDEDCGYCTTSHPNVNLFLFLMAYIAFLVFGACMFAFLENSLQLQLREQVVRRQQAFLLQHPEVAPESLNELLDFITTMQAKGVHWEPLPITKPSGPLSTGPQSGQQSSQGSWINFGQRPTAAALPAESHNVTAPGMVEDSGGSWDFTSSLLFVASIVTTIGYGHVTPLTHAGKVACMLYRYEYCLHSTLLNLLIDRDHSPFLFPRPISLPKL